MAEPNNSISDAQTFKFETIYKDSIATASDVDYFKIDQVSNPSQISIDFTGLSSTSSNDEFTVSIVNASNALPATSGYSMVTGISKTLKSSLAKDTPYYLKVAKGTGYSNAEYSVIASVVTTAEASGEKNVNDNISNINNATVLVPNADFTGYLGSSSAANGSDIDHYSFTTGTVVGSTVKIDVSSFSSNEDLYTVSVVDKNGTVVQKGITNVQATVGTTQKQTLDFTVTDGSGKTPAGTYFLKINAINADNFNKSAEKTKPYTIKLYGTSDFNEPPSVSISGIKSGLVNTTVENTTAKTVSVDATVKLSDFIVATDPDTDSTNKTVSDYYIGLLDSNTGNTSGKITYKKDGSGSSQTITPKTSKDADGFLQKITAAEFASANYVGASSTETDEQAIYTFVVDNSGSTVPNPIKTSGIVFQKINTKNIKVEVTSSHGGATPNKALKEGQKDSGTNDGTDKQTLTFKLTGGKDGVAVSVVVNPVDAELVLDSSTGKAPNNTVVLTPSGGTTATKTVDVWAKSDGKADAGKETLKFTTTSSDSDYKNLTIPDLVFDVSEVKAKFSISELVYAAADEISKAATITAGANLAIDGAFKSGSKAVFSSPQKVIITSVADESTRTFKVTGTDKNGNTGVVDNIKGVNNGVATGTVDYRSIDSITLVTGNGNTTGKVSAGIASLLEGDDQADTNSATYTITASEFPSGKTLTVTPTSADLIVGMNGTSNTSYDFTDNGSVTVKLTAKQDNEDENNPEEAILKTVVLQDGKVESLYAAAIADIKVNVEDKNKPIGSDSVVTGDKSTSSSPKTINFKKGDFGYSDPDGNPIVSLKITDLTIPTGAEFKLSGSTINKNDVITAADLSNITFKPENDKGGVNYANFKFLVNDGSEEAASASTMKINIGKSVALNVQFWADNSKKIKSTTIDTLVDTKGDTDASNDAAVSGGPFVTDSDGKLDLTGVPNGTYYGGYKAATDSTTKANIKKAVNIDDIMAILKDIGKVTTLSNKGKVGADINTDSKVNIDDIMAILKIIGGVNKHSDLSSQFVLRDNSESDPFTNNTFKIESPSALTLDSYLLGDADGNYKDYLS